MTDKLDGMILLPRLRVENVNGISGPMTWGFPAPSAFTGFAHALHRRLGDDKIRLDGAGIVLHMFDPQITRPEGRYHYRFNLARHPMGKDGKPPGTVEECRAHMEVSLLIGVHGYMDDYDGKAFANRAFDTAMGMRLAGGSIRPGPSGKRYDPEYIELSGTVEGDENTFRDLRRRLLPGFALVGRSQLLGEYLAEMRESRPDSTPLDAMLDLVRINYEPVPVEDGDGEKTEWRAIKRRPGWLVPLPAGYGAISEIHPPGSIKNARDETTPFRFVECLYTLGEWVSPLRLKHPEDMMWRHAADPDAGLYLIEQKQSSI